MLFSRFSLVNGVDVQYTLLYPTNTGDSKTLLGKWDLINKKYDVVSLNPHADF